MKNIQLLAKRISLGLVLSIGLALSGVALAQTPTQTEKKDGESCCAMACCKGEMACCKGDSCSMKDHAKKDHSKDHSKHSAKDGSCCCKGDSCKMDMKDKKAN